MKITRLNRVAVIGAAGLTMFALAACTPSAPAPAPAPTESSSAAPSGPDMTPATIKLILAPVFYEPVYIAEQEGLFAEQNLTVEIVPGGTAGENTAQLIANQANIAMTSAAALIPAVAQGVPLLTILGATSSDPDVVTSGLLATAASGIKSPKDFAGKTICLQGLNETTHLGTLMLAKEAGIAPEQMTFVQLPLPNIVSSVVDGTCDVGYPIGNAYAGGLAQGLVQVGEPSVEALAYGPSVTYAATAEWIAANESVVQRFQIALAEAAELGRANNFELIRAVQLEKSQTPPDVIKSQTLAGYQTDMYTSGWEKTLDGMAEFGFIKQAMPLSDVISSLAPMQP